MLQRPCFLWCLSQLDTVRPRPKTLGNIRRCGLFGHFDDIRDDAGKVSCLHQTERKLEVMTVNAFNIDHGHRFGY